MKVQVVIGANYGDEGKGLVSGCLAREANKRNEKSLTVFYNGTMQRAHTFEDEVHRAMASGTKYGSDTFYHSRFVIDPISLFILQAKPIIDPECRIILPCDVVNNRNKEKERGRKRHGSCGFGLFEAVKRSRNPKYLVTAKDLQDSYSLYYKLREIEKDYPTAHDDLYNMHYFMAAVRYLNAYCKIASFEEIAGQYNTIIYEGGQGLMLDQKNMDCFPHLTPSSPGTANIAADINSLHVKPELFYVSRSYLTRHGAGPLTRECSKEDINPEIIDNTNIHNEFQGSLRFGRIDPVILQRKINEDAVRVENALINVVFTQLNYTDHKIETINGKKDLKDCVAENMHIYASDQKDQMEKVF